MPTTVQEKLEGWVSVTEVLDYFIPKGLLDWYLKTGKKEAKRLSTIAKKIGSRVDELIQEDIAKGSYVLSAKDSIEVKNCMSAWEKWKEDYGLKVLATQVPLVDNLCKVMGHADIVTETVLIDVKCSSSIRDNYWLQVCKYFQMLPAEGYSMVHKVAILRLDKNLGVYEFKTNTSVGIVIGKCVEVFDGLVEAYRYYNPPEAEKEESDG